ncbi:hypothetical protein LWP59_18785 [Amycolatopsis acidiphila]|uniref:Uncharacterized protein n=1 Tax=Amycolatopsis acidiphila TaxID=715473 RepID=A0A558AAP8_9PSEU|nr:hypothetical protein [Amycolatopsis acidiphila]TVT21314.1 hypothetical protein FNH06_17220 [Amycolatopsis acidiphila]UIJ63527.1 hypothetical protein LWP59_18785 [Amycolatopsis acidiphila]GHG68449.1 hypothetical protein GCM10017788_28130 [Amycolatopsis acidiphila]
MNATEATLRSLHGIAELVLAGPQHRASGRIRLRATPGGFGTTLEPDLRVEGDQLVAGTRRIPLEGATYRDVARAAGVEAGSPAGLYKDGSGAGPDERIVLDPTALRAAVEAFAAGEEALRRFAPAGEPVLWPEHFDLAVTVDEINYGVSPGDGYSPEPYAYVGPHRPRQGPFWTAPFGAARALRELPDIAAFFAEGRDAAARS